MVANGTPSTPIAELNAWSTACPDWRDRLIAGTSLMPALPLDQVEADLAVSYFDDLRLHDVIGSPPLKDAAGKWFREIVRAVFGSFDASTGRRAIRDVFVLVPKKNAKTTYSAALMVVALLMNQRPSAEFALFGPTQAIAQSAFDAVAGMIRLDEGLSRLLHIQDHLKIVTHAESGATLKVMTFDPKIATGKKFAGALIDEIHELGSFAYAENVIQQIRGARTAILENFVVMITTQSPDQPAGVFLKELTRARAVRDGERKAGGFLPLLYEFPEEVQKAGPDVWANPEIWHRVHPNLGRPFSIADLHEDFEAKRPDGQATVRLWASQHLNIQIGVGLHDARWAGADHWEAAADRTLSFGELIARSEVVVFGADGGGLDDLFGFAALGREKQTGRWLHWGHAWADDGILEIHKQAAPRLIDFQKAGDLTLFDLRGNAHVGVLEMMAMIDAARDAGLLPEQNGIGLDRSGVAASLLVDALLAGGYAKEFARAVGQGYRLQSAHGLCAVKLKQGVLHHAGQPMMDWCVGNAKAETQGHATVITKQTSGVAKIDPLIALFNAADLMSYNPVAAAANAPAIYV